MGFLLDTLDDAKFNAQRDIVKNERRQSYDNQPYGRDGEIIGRGDVSRRRIRTRGTSSAAWTDLSAASVDDVKNFFRLYYAPNNATSSIVGDFDPAQAKAWVAKYFGDIPRGKRDHAAEGRAGHARRREAARLRGPRAGAAALRAVADGRREAATISTRSTCSARS